MPSFPWPRRGVDESTLPLELLVDVSFVAALSQSVRLVREVPGVTGLLQALALTLTVFILWILGMIAATIASMNVLAAKAFVLAQAALFVLMAVIAPVAFTKPQRGTVNGPLMLAIVVTGLVVACGGYLTLAWTGVPVGRNRTVVIIEPVPFAIAAWLGVWRPELVVPGLLFAFVWYVVLNTLVSSPNTYEHWRFGACPAWGVYAPGAFIDRFTAAYLAACALSLELLDQLASTADVTVARVLFVVAALAGAVSLFWLYRPLPALAQNVMDPRSERYAVKHKLSVVLIGVLNGHLLMVAGIGMFAASLAGDFLHVTAPGTGWFGAPLPTQGWRLIAAGLGALLVGQALYAYTITRRLDPARAVAALVIPGAVVAVHAAPAAVLVGIVAGLCATLVSVLRRGRIRWRLTDVRHAAFYITPLAEEPAEDDVRYRPSFDELDANGDGVISWADFEDRLAALAVDDPEGHESRREAAWELWTSMRNAMDLNDDHVITWPEYRAYHLAMDLDPGLDGLEELGDAAPADVVG